MSARKRIAVDFDKTIFTYGPDFTIGPPVPFAIETLYELAERRHEIIIYSARANLTHQDRGAVPAVVAIAAMQDALERWRVPYTTIDPGYNGKPLVQLFIDDKGLGIPLRRYSGQYVVDWTGVRPLLVRRGFL